MVLCLRLGQRDGDGHRRSLLVATTHLKARKGPQLTAYREKQGRDLARYLQQLQVGQQAWVRADAFPAQRFAARVRTIAPLVDAQRGSVEVKLSVDQPPSLLREDMSLSVEVETARRAAALVVPVSALRGAGGGADGWVPVLLGGFFGCTGQGHGGRCGVVGCDGFCPGQCAGRVGGCLAGAASGSFQYGSTIFA